MRATDENKAYNKHPIHAMPDIRTEISGECLGSIGGAFTRAFSHSCDWESQEEVAKDNTQSGAIVRRYRVRCSKGWKVLRRIFKELERWLSS